MERLAGRNRGNDIGRVKDLLANSLCRSREGRFDEAVARLYRAIEATAQVRLREGRAIPDTSKVPLQRLLEALARQWAGRAAGGMVFLGLRDDYVLLLTLDDDLGKVFHELGALWPLCRQLPGALLWTAIAEPSRIRVRLSSPPGGFRFKTGREVSWKA